MAPSPEQTIEVFNHFYDAGCCRTCCLRLLGNRDKTEYRSVDETLQKLGVLNQNGIDMDEKNKLLPETKISKPNPCIGCLGLLQSPYRDSIVAFIVSNSGVDGYDTETFNLSLNIPSCCLLRSEALLVSLRTLFPAYYEKYFETQSLFGLKDAFKASIGHELEKTFKLKLDLSSGFVIDVEFAYNDNEKECEPLCRLKPKVFTANYVRRLGFPKNQIESILEKVSDKEFSQEFHVPPVVPSKEIFVVKTSVMRESTNVAGRYKKYCRDLPQTPWVLNGERKMESSVEEMISEPIVIQFGGVSSKFASSGREDVDVRSLGRGRPFNVEVVMPKSGRLTFQQLRDLERDINEKWVGKLSIRDLQIVPRESLVTLKKGEEIKTKIYSALCICPDGVPDCLEAAVSKTPLILEQATPIRVLHRRPVAVRPRTIHEMSVKRLEENKHEFILNMKTQAGTYVKEFIHGDFGRTKPSLGEILGGIRVDILALDVIDVALDWPPTIG